MCFSPPRPQQTLLEHFFLFCNLAFGTSLFAVSLVLSSSMTFVSPQTISRNSGYVYDENFVIYRTFVLGTQRTEDIYTQDNGRWILKFR